MFRKIAAPVCLAVCALVAGMSHASTAKAREVGSFVLHNESGIEVNYTIKWSDGDVESFTIPAGVSRAHTVPVDYRGRGATATIMFDNELGDGRITVASYSLTAYIVDDAFDGKDYKLVTTADGSELELYAG